MEKNKISFIGSGIIGSGLAVNAMMHGHPTTLQTRSQVKKMKNRVVRILRVMVENSVCTKEEADKAASLATYTTSIEEAATGAAFIQESGPDNLDLKKSLYAEIEKYCHTDTIIASSTTNLLPSDIQQGARNPERILVGHPYHPSYLLPLVEVCGGKETSAENIEKARTVYEDIGKVPIVAKKEVRGAIVNRLSWAAFGEAKKTVVDGICSAEDMDKAIMYGPGMRMAITGQINTISLGAEGGFRAMAAKYGGDPNPEDVILADSLDAAYANRDPKIGKDEDSIADYRDSMIVTILKAQGMM